MKFSQACGSEVVFPLYMLAYPTFSISFSMAIRFPVILGLSLLVCINACDC